MSIRDVRSPGRSDEGPQKREERERRIDSLLAEMSLEEKVAMTAGTSMWFSTGVPRLGVPPLKVSDGPNGARGGQLSGGVSAACVPCGSALGATWNPDLVHAVGEVLGEEAKTKGAHVLLAPTVNIHRTPLAGRNFECYSEDPHLSARLAVAFVDGVQSRGVGTSIKHYVCNDSEFQRHTISSDVDERTLREIYLVPFEAAVAEARPWSLMSAYNKVNGTFSSEHEELLTRVLKEEWGFEGFVISDWFGTNDTVGLARGGLDLEMPGPPRQLGPKLLDAVKSGAVDPEIVDDKVRRLLRVTIDSGALAAAEAGEADPEEHAVDRPEHRAVARRAAGESIVLLKNESVAGAPALPLLSEAISSLAVIGPNAARAVIGGGGSAQVPAHYSVTPLAGLEARAGGAVQIRYAVGCTNHKLLPDLSPECVAAPGDGSVRGLSLHYFNSLEPSGDVVASATSTESQFAWLGRVPDGVDPRQYSVRLSGTFTAAEDGEYHFGLSSAGKSRLFVDGEEIVDNWTAQEPGETFFGMGSKEAKGSVAMQAGERYTLAIHFSLEGSPVGALRIGCLPPIPADSVERAAALAAECDAAVVVVGLDRDWETEGRDRVDMELPGGQAELINRVAAANPRTIVVLNCGSPIAMPWIDDVPAVLAAWYGGQEAGNAIADVLFGDRNPSGHLPTTFPRRLEDAPGVCDGPLGYPGEDGHVRYREGLLVGYRHYDTNEVEPLFPFGHGLSYTHFDYGDLELSSPEPTRGDLIAAPLVATLSLTNAGDRHGAEVVQLYVRDLESTLDRPDKELRAFEKLDLAPGESTQVRFDLGERAFAAWDPTLKAWTIEPGDFELLAGPSSRDLRASARVSIR